MGDVRQLCDDWAVGTIRDAMRLLIRKGLVERVSRDRFKITEGCDQSVTDRGVRC